MNELQIAKMNKVLDALTGESVTKTEFLTSFKKVIEQVLKIEAQLLNKVNRAINELEKIQNTQQTQIKGEVNDLVIQAKRSVDSALKEQENGMNFIYDKIRRLKNGLDGKDGKDGKDGLDADEQKIIREILDKIEMPELTIDAIDGLREEIKRLESLPRKGGGGFSYIHLKSAGGLTGTGTSHVTVAASAPSNPATGDLWVDTS